jgi:GntR family transcriptional regulator, trigonelline degradation regulator
MRDSYEEKAMSTLENAGLDFPVVKKRAAPLRRDVVDALRKAIIEGRLAPGARLIERQLIDMTGVSRTVIREALRQLESESIVETIPNKGPIVRQLTRAEAEDLYSIRSVLEGLAARMFVSHAKPADIVALKDALDRTAAAYRDSSPDVILAVKNEFYSILFAGAGSETLSSMTATLYARIWRWRALGLGHPKRSPGRSKQSVTALRDLYQALKKRDGELAEKIARQETMNAAAEIMRIFDETDAETL